MMKAIRDAMGAPGWAGAAGHDASAGAASRPLADRVALAIIGAVVVLGFLLRVAAARGDLWLDEIWSLTLVADLRWPGEAFWALPHDNNHPLNSAWMALVGPDRPAFLYRPPAVLFGAATIAAAARFGWRTNPAAAVMAATLVACGYPFVLYGSEARGYAGLILATILAYDEWARLMEAREAGTAVPALRRQRWTLASIALFGTASHFTMLGAVAVLGLATVLRRGRACGLRGAIDEALALYRPVLIALAPLVLAVAGGALAKGGFTVGGLTPFAPSRFVEGYGGLLTEMLGLRPVMPAWAGLPVAAVLLAGGFRARLIDRRMLPLAASAFIVLPAALFAARVGNAEYPRYFLVAGLPLPLMMAEMAGRLWSGSRAARAAAVLLVALPCCGQGPDMATLLADHRGAPAAALAGIAPGATILLRGDAPFAADLTAAYHGKAGQHVFISPKAPLPCAAPPDWLIRDGGLDAPAADRMIEGAPTCPTAYSRTDTYPTALWSGRSWTVYHRDT